MVPNSNNQRHNDTVKFNRRLDAPNIVKRIRMRNNVTQEHLAELAGLSTLFVIRAEQSLHNSLNDDLAKVLSFLSGLAEDNPDALKETYVQEKQERIDYLIAYLTGDPFFPHRVRIALEYAVENYSPVGEIHIPAERRLHHPFYLFRTSLFKAYDLPTSQIKFSTLTGLHPATINALENRQASIEPGGAVEGILLRLRIDPEIISILRKLCDDCL